MVIQHEDEEGNLVKDNDTFIEQTAVDSPFDYNFKKEIEKTDFYQKNKDKYEIVSIDGVAAVSYTHLKRVGTPNLKRLR